MSQLFINEVSAILDSAIGTTETSITVDRLSKAVPTLTGDDYFLATIYSHDDSQLAEIVKVTAVNGNVWTIEREQEDSLLQPHLKGAGVELRLTAGSMDTKADKDSLDPTKASVNLSLLSGETAKISWDNPVSIPITSVTKEIPQEDISSSDWDVNSNFASEIVAQDCASVTPTVTSGYGYLTRSEGTFEGLVGSYIVLNGSKQVHILSEAGYCYFIHTLDDLSPVTDFYYKLTAADSFVRLLSYTREHPAEDTSAIAEQVTLTGKTIRTPYNGAGMNLPYFEHDGYYYALNSDKSTLERFSVALPQTVESLEIRTNIGLNGVIQVHTILYDEGSDRVLLFGMSSSGQGFVASIRTDTFTVGASSIASGYYSDEGSTNYFRVDYSAANTGYYVTWSTTGPASSYPHRYEFVFFTIYSSGTSIGLAYTYRRAGVNNYSPSRVSSVEIGAGYAYAALQYNGSTNYVYFTRTTSKTGGTTTTSMTLPSGSHCIGRDTNTFYILNYVISGNSGSNFVFSIARINYAGTTLTDWTTYSIPKPSELGLGSTFYVKELNDSAKVVVVCNTTKLFAVYDMESKELLMPFTAGKVMDTNLSHYCIGEDDVGNILYASDYNSVTPSYEFSLVSTGKKAVVNSSRPVTQVTAASIDTTYWLELKNFAPVLSQGNEAYAYVSFSTDGKESYLISDPVNGTRVVCKKIGSDWYINEGLTYTDEVLTLASGVDNDKSAVSEALRLEVNRMAITDTAAILSLPLGTSLDMAVTTIMGENEIDDVPYITEFTLTYDGLVKNQEAINGTDYVQSSSLSTELEFTALVDGNFKVRVV